jgi:hypothetical protein
LLSTGQSRFVLGIPWHCKLVNMLPDARHGYPWLLFWLAIRREVSEGRGWGKQPQKLLRQTCWMTCSSTRAGWAARCAVNDQQQWAGTCLHQCHPEIHCCVSTQHHVRAHTSRDPPVAISHWWYIVGLEDTPAPSHTQNSTFPSEMARQPRCTACNRGRCCDLWARDVTLLSLVLYSAATMACTRGIQCMQTF